MNTFLVILLVAAMIATVVMLVRGLAVFLLNASNEVRDGSRGPSTAALKSNKAMQYRIFFQAIAIMIVVVILVLAGKN
jgi:heme/copper-type cytochrome/quinol oxidase subunit 2